MNSTEGVPVLTARGLTKKFGEVEALRGADFDIARGEIVALMGDNGAGKSTLVKILSGAVPPDDGSIEVNGAPVTFRSPTEARAAGIETVYQDLSLADTLDAGANLFLGRELRRGGLLGRIGFLDKAEMRRRSRQVFDELGVPVRSDTASVGTMSGGQRQGIAVCRAATWAHHVLFLDEPTAALGVRQTRNVLDLVRRVRDRGVCVVLITHNLPDATAVADRIEVLRLGRRVARFAGPDADAEEIVAAMTGAGELGTTSEGVTAASTAVDGTGRATAAGPA